jgi:hypothetical protein
MRHGLHHIEPNAASRDGGQLFLGAEAGQEEEFEELVVRECRRCLWRDQVAANDAFAE